MTNQLTPYVYIFVLDQGWVLVGHLCSPLGTATLKVERAQVVRNWGTTNGIGQLADGPTGSTVCDPIGTAQITSKNVMFCFQVDAEAWSSTLNPQ